MQKFSSNIHGELQSEEPAQGIVSIPRRPVDACVEDWARQIQECVKHGTVQVLDLARLIHAAKTVLQRGQWTHLCKSGQVPFSKRKAEMLDVIGESLGGLNAQTSAHLPPGWNTLYYLARLPQSLLASLIADGSVHPALTLVEAKSLYARFKGLGSNAGKRPDLRRRLQRFQQFVLDNSEAWTPAERQWVQRELLQLVTKLREPTESSVTPPALLLLPETSIHQQTTTRQFA